jgi:hypothetical protein
VRVTIYFFILNPQERVDIWEHILYDIISLT